MFRSVSERPPAPAGSACPPAAVQEVTHRALTADDEAFLHELDGKFSDFLDHARHYLNHSPASCRGYRYAYRDFRRFLVQSAGKAERRARLYDIEGWVAWNRKRGLGPVSTNTYWRALRPFFKYLESRDSIQNPFRGSRMPQLPTRVPKARTPEECRRILLAAANYPWATEFQRARAIAIFSILIFAGLRRGEVLRLLYSDVNLETGTIRILKGKGRNGGKDRMAYMNDELRRALAEYARLRARHGIVCPEFFASLQTRQGISDSQFIRIVRAVRLASGVPFSIHSLRHSFVTNLLRCGVPIHVAKELAGHTDISTTAGYLRVWDDEQRDQIRKLRL